MGHGDMYCVNEREPIVLYVQLKIYVRLDLKIANTCTYLLHNLRFIRVWGGGRKRSQKVDIMYIFFWYRGRREKKKIITCVTSRLLYCSKKIVLFFFLFD